MPIENTILIWILVPIAVAFITKHYLSHLHRKKIKSIEFEVLYGKNYASEKWKIYLSGGAYILCSIVLAVVLTFLARLLRFSLFPQDALFVFAEPVIGASVPLFILSLVFMAIPLLLVLVKLFPKILSEREKQIYLRDTALMVLLASFILLPIGFVFFDAYEVVTPDKVIKNPLLSFEEKQYLIEELEKVELNATVVGKVFILKVLVVDIRGDKFELWTDWSGSPFLSSEQFNALEHLGRQGVRIYLAPPSEDNYNYVASLPESNNGKRGTQVAGEVRQIFQRLEAIASGGD